MCKTECGWLRPQGPHRQAISPSLECRHNDVVISMAMAITDWQSHTNSYVMQNHSSTGELRISSHASIHLSKAPCIVMTKAQQTSGPVRMHACLQGLAYSMLPCWVIMTTRSRAVPGLWTSVYPRHIARGAVRSSMDSTICMHPTAAHRRDQEHAHPQWCLHASLPWGHCPS